MPDGDNGSGPEAVLREVRSNACTMMKDFNSVLSPYNRPLSGSTLTRPAQNLESLVEDFGTGASVVMVLVQRGVLENRFLSDMKGRPKTQEEFLTNMAVVIKALKSVEIPVYLSPKEFLSPPIPCPESLLLQLYEVWKVAFSEVSRSVRLSGKFRFADSVPVKLKEPEKSCLQITRKGEDGASVGSSGAKAGIPHVKSAGSHEKVPISLHEDVASSTVAQLPGDVSPTTQIIGGTVEFDSGLVVTDCTIWSHVVLCAGQWIHTVNFADRNQQPFLQIDTGLLSVHEIGCLEVPAAGILDAANTDVVSLHPDVLNRRTAVCVKVRGVHEIHNFSQEIRILAHFIHAAQGS